MLMVLRPVRERVLRRWTWGGQCVQDVGLPVLGGNRSVSTIRRISSCLSPSSKAITDYLWKKYICFPLFVKALQPCENLDAAWICRQVSAR